MVHEQIWGNLLGWNRTQFPVCLFFWDHQDFLHAQVQGYTVRLFVNQSFIAHLVCLIKILLMYGWYPELVDILVNMQLVRLVSDISPSHSFPSCESTRKPALANHQPAIHEFPQNWLRFYRVFLDLQKTWFPRQAGLQGSNTPWKMNMEHTNHPFRKENDLPNLYDYVPC